MSEPHNHVSAGSERETIAQALCAAGGKGPLRCQSCGAVVVGEPQELREALNLAVNIIMADEPGDSRAVSDEAVALAAVACGDTSAPVMKVIRTALAVSRPK